MIWRNTKNIKYKSGGGREREKVEKRKNKINKKKEKFSDFLLLQIVREYDLCFEHKSE